MSEFVSGFQSRPPSSESGINFRTILILEMLAMAGLLVLSVWPGVLHDLLFLAMLSAILWVPAAVIAAIVAMIIKRTRPRHEWSPPSSVQVSMLLLIASATAILLWYEIPRRVAFIAARESFEAASVAAPLSPPAAPRRTRIGIYHVQCAADRRGGIFFRVHSGGDGISPDTMSYGFAKRPNREGTPFGAARYRLTRISDDWFLFQASDDW